MSICTPITTQGMTVAAKECLVLAELLEERLGAAGASSATSGRGAALEVFSRVSWPPGLQALLPPCTRVWQGWSSQLCSTTGQQLTSSAVHTPACRSCSARWRPP